MPLRFADFEQTTRERARRGEELQFWLESQAGLNPPLGLPRRFVGSRARNARWLGPALPSDPPKNASEISAALARTESNLWAGGHRFT